MFKLLLSFIALSFISLQVLAANAGRLMIPFAAPKYNPAYQFNDKLYGSFSAFVGAPVVASFAPNHGPVGTLVMVTGTGLDDVTTLNIGSKPALIVSQTATSLTAMIMPGTVDGKLSATNGSGTMTTTGSFLVSIGQPPVNLQAGKVGYLEGQSIALSADGNTMAVKGKDNTGTKGGPTHPPHPSEATVYKRTGANWAVYAEVSGRVFQLSADGKTLMSETGIYTDNGSGAFALQYTLPVSGSISLSADGKLAIVGKEGNVYTYKNTNGVWAASGNSITEVSHSNSFGYAVSLSADGKTALVTDYLAYLPAGPSPGFYTDSLGAWVYTRSGDSWVKQVQLPTYGKKTETLNAWNNTQAISADGNRIIINKIFGTAMIFNRTGSTWSQILNLPYSTGTGTVSLSADGKTAMFAEVGDAGFGVDIYKETGADWVKVFSGRQPPVSNDGTTHGTAEYTSAALSADGSTAVSGTLGYWNSGVIVYSNVLPPPVNPLPTLSYNVTNPTLAQGQAVTLNPVSANVGAYGYDALTNPASSTFMTGFGYPNAIARDAAGLNVYVADRTKKQIVVMPIDHVGDIAGHATRVYDLDSNPFAVAVDQQNNVYYSADTVGHNIIKCPQTGGCVVYSTEFTAPLSMATNKAGDLYVVDSQEHKVKKISAGGGTAVDLGGTWSAPDRIAVDDKGNVYVTDILLKVIRKIPADGSAPVDIDISAYQMTFAQYGLTVDNSGNIFTSQFTPSGTEVREWFADGSASVAVPFKAYEGEYPDASNKPKAPKGIVVDALGRLQISDAIPTQRVQTVAPIGGYFVQPALPQGLNLDRNTGVISGTPTKAQAVTTYTITGWNTNGYASTSITLGVQLAMPSIAYAGSGQTFNLGQAVNLTPTSANVGTYGYDALNYPNSTSFMTGLGYPNAIATDAAGINVYVADRYQKRIVVIPADHVGDIEGHATRIINTENSPFAIAVDQQNNIYYADTVGHDIIKCPPTGGCAVYATGFTFAFTMAFNKAGDLYVIDSQEQKVKKVPAGGGTPVDFGGTWSAPNRLAVDAEGNVFVTDLALKIVRKIPADGSAPVNFDAGITFPQSAQYGITADNSGNIFTSLFSPSAVEVRGAFADGSGSFVIPFQPFTFDYSSNRPYLPKGIIVDALGRLQIADGLTTKRVETVRPIGGYFVQPALPKGLNLDRNTGAITGTPTKTQAATAYTITGWNANGYTSTSITLGVQATTPTVSATKLLFTNTTANSTTVSWTNGNGAKRAVFIAKTANGVANPADAGTYNANAAFGNGTQIASSGWFCIYNGTGSTVDVTGLLSNTTYRVTVVEYNGDPSGEKYLLNYLAPASVTTPLSASDAPTVPSTALNFINTTSATTTVRWTSGNGANRAVFIAKTANGVAAPVDATGYTANPVFGSGAQIGSTGWYCIYNGNAASVDVSGLLSSTTYRVTVVEYNGTGASAKYMNTKLAPASVATLASPTVAPTAPSLKLTFSNTTTNSTTVSWTSGNGAKRAVFVAKTANGVANAVDNATYVANGNFAAGTQIGATGWYCVYNGTGNSANLSGLLANTTYRVTVIEYNGTTGVEKYMNTMLNPAGVNTLPSAAVAPTTPARVLTFTGTTTNSTTLSWASGSGAKRAVFISRTANGVANAVNNITYTANPAFAAGTQIGATAWYCVYNGTGSSVNLTGLTDNTTYRLTVIEYNGNAGAEQYANTALAPANVVTLAAGPVAPTVPSRVLTFTNVTNAAATISWTSGNGNNRAVFIARTGNGYAVPADNITYTANTGFGAGSQAGSTGWYCIYNGNGSSTNVTGLSTSQTYRVTVVEYNGSTGTQKYMTTGLAPASFVTLANNNIGGNPLFTSSLATDDLLAADTKVEASNLLSPNGDGKNDTWVVKNLDKYPNNSVTVYDQASGVVYTKKGYTNDWAGTYRGGIVNEGTYYYTIDLGNGNTMKGFITVLRNRQ